MTIAVECSKLTKNYGSAAALNEVSFRLEAGQIYGLLGRNGAGKTTLMNALTGQVPATSGEVRLFGKAPFENHEALSKVCFIKESQQYVKSFRVRDVLALSAKFFEGWDSRYAEELLKEFELDPGKKIKQLSRGMHSAVGIIIGLASRAPLTIFDEPYLGLDAVARVRFYDRLLADFTEHPRTIVLSTHLIDEVSKLFGAVLILDKGRLLLHEDSDELRASASYVSGKAELVDRLVAGHRIIHTEGFGSAKVAAIYGALSEEARREAARDGLEISSVPLQRLLVYLTDRTQKGAGQA